MGKATTIPWCHRTFSPWWGCSRVSEACRFCYAEAWAKRWGKRVWGKQAPRRFLGDDHWKGPVRWQREAEKDGARFRVFSGSMCDVLENRPDLLPWRQRLWDLVPVTPRLTWLFLTKRPENALRMMPAAWKLSPPPNVWWGTTTEDQRHLEERTEHLAKIPATVRFLSVEPMLGPLDLRHANVEGAVHWAIAGGESGPQARPMEIEWARSLRDQAAGLGIAFFMKQMGTAWARGVKASNSKGEAPSEWPEDLRVRQFPEAQPVTA